MRGREMLDTIENLNPAYIEAAAEKPKTKKTNWLKWGAMAACLAVVVIAGISMLPGNNTVQTSIGGVMREYKNVSVASSEVAIEWPWEYKTLYEQFSTIIYDGREYTVKTIGLAADESAIGEKLGVGEGVGYDAYTEQEYRQSFDVWKISGISADLMIAAEMDGQFYTFKYSEYVPPATLGEVLDNYSLRLLHSIILLSMMTARRPAITACPMTITSGRLLPGVVTLSSWRTGLVDASAETALLLPLPQKHSAYINEHSMYPQTDM